MDFVPYLKYDPTPKSTLNIFDGFKYYFEPFDQTLTCKIKRILNHFLEVVSSGNDEVYEYLLDWLADMIQNPNKKNGVAILLKSRKEGAGKNSMTDLLMDILGKSLSYTTDRLEDLTNKFNAHLQGKLLIVADELANYAGHKVADTLKSMITCTRRPIEDKGKAIVMVSARERYIFTSNSDIPLRISSSDRRYLALEVSDKYIGDSDYFDSLYEELESEDSQRAFFLYLANRNIARDWKKIPMTGLKRELMKEAVCNIIHYLIDVGNEDRDSFLGEFKNGEMKVFSQGLFNDYRDWASHGGYKGQLNKTQFSRKMKELGLEKIPIRAAGVVGRGYKIVRNNLQAIICDEINDPNFCFS